MSILVSIITPCFNHGQYLEDAINSIPYNKLGYEIEHIIINDGSTDEDTIKKITEINDTHIKVIHQDNQGLAAARNAGIAIALGKYIIPLDADNKLHENYLIKAIEILENDIAIDVVYGDMYAFENETWINRPGEFDIVKILTNNYIDACAVFRKACYQKFGLYDGNKLYGYEDWDMWINLYFKGARFHYLKDIGFWYRVTNMSMLRTIGVQKFEEVRNYVFKKYAREITEFFLMEDAKHKQTADTLNYVKRNPIKAMVQLILKRF